MVTCSDYIIFNMRTSITCSNDILLKIAVVSASSERQSSAQLGRREDTDVFCFVLFLFFFHGRFEQGLK